jgi:uncharacterized phage protein (TIGR02218 family)
MKSLPLTLTSRVVKPARLVVITRRDGTVLRIAEAQSAITAGGNVYAPLAGCEISAVKHTLGGETPSMQIAAAHNSTGTEAFNTADIDIGLYDAAEVELFIVDRTNPATLGLLFSGTIQPVSYDIAGRVSFDIKGPSVNAGVGYIQTFSPMCRTDLFSSLCGLNPDDYDQAATITAIINRFNFTISITAGADGYLNGGVLQTSTGIAFEIANQTGTSLTSFLPCSRLIAVSMAVTVWPGCDKRIGTCHDKFSNTLNFQGEPHSIGVHALAGGGG